MKNLTKKEKEVLKLIINSNQKIAQQLNTSEGTIKLYMSSIFQKLNAKTRTHALIAALKTGMIDIGEIDCKDSIKKGDKPHKQIFIRYPVLLDVKNINRFEIFKTKKKYSILRIYQNVSYIDFAAEDPCKIEKFLKKEIKEKIEE